MLDLKQSLLSQEVDQFLSDPRKQTLGPKGFRLQIDTIQDGIRYLRDDAFISGQSAQPGLGAQKTPIDDAGVFQPVEPTK